MNYKNLVRITNISDNKWLDFINRCPQSSIFHHPAWLHTIGETYKLSFIYYVFLNSNNEILAGIPLFKINRKKICSIPFTDHCSVLHLDDQAFTILMNGLNEIKSNDRSYKIQIRSNVRLPLDYHVDDQFNLHTLELSKDTSELYENLSSNIKRGIRRANREGLFVREENNIDSVNKYYDLHLSTRKRQGIPVQPKMFFNNLWKYTINCGLGRFIFVYKDSKPVAGAVFLQFNKVFVYKYGGSISKYWNLRPNNLLFWYAIQLANNEGYTKFDWGRTNRENKGLLFFKNQWNCEKSTLYYYRTEQYKKSMWNMSAFNILKKTIKIAPSFFCRAVGELFYKYSIT